MGWWQSLWGSDDSQDPLAKLDPKLREYLKKESPVKYPSSQPESAPQAASIVQPSAQYPSPATTEAKDALVPRESQFQDGRYAHLWKTYRPLAEIEAETKSDQEKIMDVLDGYKSRKAEIGKAALENCALEQVDWRTCMSNPSITERMTMCRTQIKKFERCYTMQTRFLKALGYLSTYDRPAEVEEDIQMHADALYHRLLSQEAAVEAAKAEGKPIPTFPPLITVKRVAASASPLNAEQQEALQARLAQVDEQERPAEEEAFIAEQRVKSEIASRVQDIRNQQEAERKARKETGAETAWDKVMGMISPGPNNSDKK
ncbi:hypothetical protein BX600DRAFT_448401 [Xylariales sp. PMI_506]|nr:hypothetical protein BX600DRAFT_448401 [Xylariales sp. PMI_506]